jgi:hypothetical protein
VLYPVVPLARRQALGIAVMSYDGHLGFGLLGDYDALPDLDTIARDIERAIASLARAAGVRGVGARAAKTASNARKTARRTPATVSSNDRREAGEAAGAS